MNKPNFFALLPQLLLLLLMSISLTVKADAFKPGVHYQLIEDGKSTTGAKVEVLEFFNYACPHCYSLEPVVTQWKTTKAGYIDFKQVPAFWNPIFKHFAQAFYTAEALGKVDELHQPIFKAIHIRGPKQDIKTFEGLAELFQSYGVEIDATHKAYYGFSTQQNLTKAARLFRTYGLSSVPVFVIDGRYVANVKSAGDSHTLMQIIDYLAAKSRKNPIAAPAEK